MQSFDSSKNMAQTPKLELQGLKPDGSNMHVKGEIFEGPWCQWLHD